MTPAHDQALAAAQEAAEGIEWWCPPAYLRTCVEAALRAYERTVKEQWRKRAMNVDRGRG